MNEGQFAVPDMNLPDDLRAFLAAGRRLEYDPDDSEAGAVELVPLQDLKIERFPVETGPVPDQDPGYPGVNSFLVAGVNLVASCTGDYEPMGLLLWLPLEGRYGIWDSSHCGIQVFGPEVTWERIAANAAPHIDAGWTGFNSDSPAMEDLIPWPTQPRQDLPVYDVQPAEPEAKPKSNVPLPDTDEVVTKRFQTIFKGLTLGVTTLEEAKRRPDAVPGARRPRPNALVQPDLWIGNATLQFDEDERTLSSVHIYEDGFVDINGVSVGGAWSQLVKLAGKKVAENFYIDECNGIVYLDDLGQGKVTSIAYASSLRVRAP